MNDKIAKTMLYLCIGYLSVFYVLKFFFPELLIQVISSPTLIRLGEFIGTWIGFQYIVTLITSALTFYLFICACTGKFTFSKIQTITFICILLLNNIVCYALPELYTHTCTSSMIFLAYFCDGKFKYTVITFTIHGYLSQFLASIRGFETIFVYIKAVSGILLNLEVDVWLVLLTIIFYLKEKRNGTLCTSLPQQEC